MTNRSLRNARIAKKDEFYTQYADISKELVHYKSKTQKRLDSDKECALTYRSANIASDRAVENLALKIIELKKRLEVAHNEQ